MHDNVFFIDQQAFNVDLTTDVVNNAFVLTCNDLSAGFRSGSFRYKVAPLIVASGYAEVDMNTVKIQVGLKFVTQTLADGRVVPAFESVDVVVDIDRNDIKIHLGGGFITDIASLFEVFFKGTVVDLIRDSVTTALETTLPSFASSYVAGTECYAKPFRSIDVMTAILDWETKEEVLVDAFRLTGGMKGLFFDTDYGVIEPTGVIPDLKRHEDTEQAGFQVFASAWSLNSFFLTLNEEFTLAYTLKGSNIPNLNTGYLNTGLPGIADYYGPDQPVDVELTLLSVQNITVRENDDTLSAMSALNAKFYVYKTDGTRELAVDIDGTDMYTNFTVLINDMTVAGNVTAVNVGKIKQNYCSFGRIPLTTEKFFLNKMINLFLPEIDAYLNTKQLTLPTELFGLFKLSDLVIRYYDEYIMLGVTPTFEPLAYASQYKDGQFYFDPSIKANPAYMPKKDYFMEFTQ